MKAEAENRDLESRDKRFSRQYWLRLGCLATVSILIALLGLLTYVVQLQVDLLVTPHRDSNVGTPAEISRPYQNVTLTTADGLNLAGWYVAGTEPHGIVLIHGLNTNRAAMLPEAAVLAQGGYHLLLIDLRGHGQSEGELVTYGYREALDVQAAVDYLLALPQIENVGAVGISMGGAAVARAAALDPRLKAVVIEYSYSSLSAAVDDAFDNFSLLPRRPFAPLIITLAERRIGLEVSQVDTTRSLAALHPRPVLIIHNLNDRLFPPEHAHRMYEAAEEPKELWLMENTGSANPVIGREAEYKERVVTFFERAFNQSQGGE